VPVNPVRIPHRAAVPAENELSTNEYVGHKEAQYDNPHTKPPQPTTIKIFFQVFILFLLSYPVVENKI
jgi:hypothetical protein